MPIGEGQNVGMDPWRLGWSVLVLTLAADWLLFGVANPGLALSLFAGLLVAVILVNRSGWREDKGFWVAALLILFAVAQAAVAFSWVNLMVLFILVTFLAGTRFDLPWRQRWPGWLEALAAWVKAMGRWSGAIAEWRAGWSDTAIRRNLTFALKSIMPGLLLLLVFGALLGAGNALAGELFGRAWRAIEEYVRVLTEVSPWRVVFWGLMATIGLALCRPARFQSVVRMCTVDWRRVSLSRDRSVALWQTWISLGVLNGLFLFVNTLDVIYLWVRVELPAGVGYSAFVHEGVYALIASTLLAGAVLSFFFQQPDEAGRSKVARALALAWIAQNLLVLSGVALRLHLYIDAFGWSVLRFHVGTFLVLTATGFGLLTLYVLKGLTMRWLVLSNLAVVFGLFYVLQFTNVPGWVAGWNVDRWIEGKASELDVGYLQSLGAPAWPALLRVVESGSGVEVHEARRALGRARDSLETSLRDQTWRSWQWRHRTWEKQLLAHEPVFYPEDRADPLGGESGIFTTVRGR